MKDQIIPTVNIHGKEYVTVSTRVQLAHADNERIFSIQTELIQTDPITFKALVTTKKGIFTGYSSVAKDSVKQIEKQNPYEVAETSAVGRALGFAGYGSTESIASADEVQHAVSANPGYVPQSDANTPSTPRENSDNGNGNNFLATEKQALFIYDLFETKDTRGKKTGKEYELSDLFNEYNVSSLKELTSDQASTIIGNLMKLPQRVNKTVDPDEAEEGIAAMRKEKA